MTKKQKIFIVILLLVTLATIACLKAGWFNNSSGSNKDAAKTTSTAPTAQEDFKNGDARSTNTTSTSDSSGNIADTNGSIGPAVDATNPIISSDGQITVYSPKKGSMISDGQTIAGVTKVTSIYYRIKDNVSGVFASGQLSVVNGKFSGNLSFKTSASEGQIDIYTVDQNDREYSNIAIPVKFK